MSSTSLSATRMVPTLRWESLNLINTQTAERSSPQNPGYTANQSWDHKCSSGPEKGGRGRGGREGTVSWRGWVIKEGRGWRRILGGGSGVTIGKQE